jgi:NAD(P)-dependent dehydrogenase (short-subunit alcohol dehydrogenase family)
MARLHNKVAVITGAASGIGLACVRRFAAEGAQVVGLDLGEPAADQLWDLSPAPLFLRLDVSDEAQTQAVMQQVVERFGRLDVLVTAARPPAPCSPWASKPASGWRSGRPTSGNG